MFKNSEIKDEFKSRNIDKAREKLRLLNMNSEERKRYERYLSNLAMEKDVIATAKEEGREEEKVEVVCNAIRAGLSDEVIASITGLSVNEIQKLRESKA